MNEFQNIWNDIKNRNYIESYIVLFVGLLLLIADVFGYMTPSIMNEINLAVLTSIVYLTILGRREVQEKSSEVDIEGITAFHANRNKMIPLEQLLAKSNKEIALYAAQHTHLIHQVLGLLGRKAEIGCKIKILMMAAKGPDGEVNPNVAETESHRRYQGLLHQLEANTNSLQHWLNSLSKQIRKNVEIRTYLEVPTATYSFIDRNEINGFVQVELLLYGIHVQDMPHYIITRKHDEHFFNIHCESFDKLWEKSQILQPSDVEKS